MPDIVEAFWDKKDPAERLHVSCPKFDKALPTAGAKVITYARKGAT